MGEQGELFPEARPVRVAEGSPRVWIRRLVVWASPGVVVREVRFRRGVNIVCSADVGVPSLGARGGTGHGVGKSLLCRFLRYGLGEPSFGTSDLMRATARRFPEGAVGLEIQVDGHTWSSIRPIGNERGAWTHRGSLQELSKTRGAPNGLGPLLDALEATSAARVDLRRFPGTANHRVWLTALAWMSRDQECRLGHVLDWRDPEAESQSPVTKLSASARLTALRLLVGAIGKEELHQDEALRGERVELDAHRAALTKLEQRVRHEHDRLARELGLIVANDAGGLVEQVDVAVLRRTAHERFQAVDEAQERTSRPPRKTQEPSPAEREHGRRREHRAALEQHMRREVLERDAVAAEVGSLTGQGLEARYGKACPICHVPIDRALAEGCGLSHVVPDKARVERDLHDARLRLADREAQVARRHAELQDALLAEGAAEEAFIANAVDHEQQALRDAWRAMRREWSVAFARCRDADALAGAAAEVQRMRAERDLGHQRTAQRATAVKDARRRSAEALGRWAELFDLVSRNILGPPAEARLYLDGHGLHAKLAIGGTAMDSLAAIAVDLAAMLMTMENRTALPGFLVHDSPREADLGLSDYHRFFNYVASLEALGAEPQFQYIVTTTTEPPAELAAQGLVVAELSGLDDATRLLGCAL